MSHQVDFRFLDVFNLLAKKIERTEQEKLLQAASKMAKAIANDRLIYIFGGGGHTTLVM